MQRWNIEISERMYETISDVFNLAGLPIPQCITSDDMRKAVHKMKFILDTTDRSKDPEKFAIIDSKLKQIKSAQTALIISDTGIIRYQLKQLLNNHHIETAIVDKYYNGLAEYYKNLYDIVIIDIKDKTKDATVIIEAIKTHSKKHSVTTSIIVLSVPGSFSTKDYFDNLGIHKFIEKVGNWYYEIEKEIKRNSFISV